VKYFIVIYLTLMQCIFEAQQSINFFFQINVLGLFGKKNEFISRFLDLHNFIAKLSTFFANLGYFSIHWTKKFRRLKISTRIREMAVSHVAR